MAIHRTCDRCSLPMIKGVESAIPIGTTSGFTRFSDGKHTIFIHAGEVTTTCNWQARHMTRPGTAEFGPGNDICDHCLAEIILGRKIEREGPLGFSNGRLLEGPDTLTPSIDNVIGFLTGDGACWLDNGGSVRIVHMLGEDIFRTCDCVTLDGTERKTLAYVNESTDWTMLRTALQEYAKRWYGKKSEMGRKNKSAACAAIEEVPTTHETLSAQLKAESHAILSLFEDHVAHGLLTYIVFNKNTNKMIVVDGRTFDNGKGVNFPFNVVVSADQHRAMGAVAQAVDDYIAVIHSREERVAAKNAPKPLILVNGKRVDQDSGRSPSGRTHDYDGRRIIRG